MEDRRSIQFWTIAESTPSPHVDLEEGVGPYLLATIAKQCGYNVSAFQASQYGCDDRLIAEQIEGGSDPRETTLAFSIFSGGIPLLRRIIARLREGRPIIIGGPGATTAPLVVLGGSTIGERVTNELPVALVQAEADEIFPELLRLEPRYWTNVREAWVRSSPDTIKQGVFGTLRNLDAKPLIDLSSSMLRQRCERTMRDSSRPARERVRAVQALHHCFMETRRGCFYKCEFCSEPQLTESGVRKTSPRRAVEEVAHLFENFGITFFNYADNIAFDNEEWWQEYAALLQKLPYAHLLQFGGYGTPKFFSKGTWLSETVPLLYRRGLSFVTLGVQSGSPRILQQIIHRPKDDPENALRIIEALVPLGVNVKTDFIVGHPTETVNDLCLTRSWVERLYQAGGHVFARRLGVVPSSGYDFHLQEGRYQLPEQSEAAERIIADILAFHGQKNSYVRVSASGGVPNLSLIDRERKIMFPKPLMDLEVLKQNYLRLQGLPEVVRERFTLLFEAVMESRAVNSAE